MFWVGFSVGVFSVYVLSVVATLIFCRIPKGDDMVEGHATASGAGEAVVAEQASIATLVDQLRALEARVAHLEQLHAIEKVTT